MESRGNREKVLQELRAHLSRDRARTKAFAVSELGLIEMTRQRVRPSLWQSMTAECPTCNGTGRVFRPEVVVRRMERSLKRAGAEHKERQLAVRLHPEVANRFTPKYLGPESRPLREEPTPFLWAISFPQSLSFTSAILISVNGWRWPA